MPADPIPSTADSIAAGSACPRDLPWAPLPERAAHLYACQGLSTYQVADVVGISRQRVTRMLHRAGVAVKSRGSGRRRLPRGAGLGIRSRSWLTCISVTGSPAPRSWS